MDDIDIVVKKRCFKYAYKPMMPLKTLDIIFRRRYLPNTQKYFTNRKHAIIANPHRKEPNDFRVPRSEKILAYIKHCDKKKQMMLRDRLRQPTHLKDNLRFAASRNISSRLFIEEPPSDVNAIVDIDDEFYTLVEGRSIRPTDDIKVYITNIRNYAMLKQQIGYRKDIMLKFEKDKAEENQEYSDICSKLKLHVHNFHKCLTDDYKKVCAKIAKAEAVEEELKAANIEMHKYISSMTFLNNLIFKLDSIRNVLKIYRRYLLFVAPFKWRKLYDETLKHTTESTIFVCDEFVTDNELVESLDIDRIVDLGKIELKQPHEPHMFFKNPREMMSLFRTMELQSREYLIQLSKSAVPIRMWRKKTQVLKKLMKKEIDVYHHFINHFKLVIAREIENEMYLQKKFMRVLQEDFFDSVASPSTLKLRICIEFVFEQIFGKTDESYVNLYDPMKLLELSYEDYNLRLEYLDFAIVNEARDENFAHDIMVMTRAQKAQRELTRFDEMSNSMRKAFLPPLKFKRPIVKKFMTKAALKAFAKAEKRKQALESGERIKAKEYKVTPEQRQSLMFFTNWREGKDPAPYLKEYEQFVKPVFEWKPPENSTLFVPKSSFKSEMDDQG